jgi:chromosomal replication initiator protein
MQETGTAANDISALESHSSSTETLISRKTLESALASSAAVFSGQAFSAYIAPLRIVTFTATAAEGRKKTIEDLEIVLSAPSKFLCTHVEKNLKEKLIASLKESLSLDSLSIKITVDASRENTTTKSPIVIVKNSISGARHVQGDSSASAEPTARPQAREQSKESLNPLYTFENFVVGRSNEFCHAAALRVAENPGKSYNPLFIYGGVGLGKTHLLHAIGNAVLARNPDSKVLYLSSETFTNDLIQALRHDKMDEFKKKLRGAHVLLVDDIQFMSGKERTQEEFFHTFNALYNSKRQIVMTCDKIPQDISGLEERLHTRFSWGLTADLQSPDFETRVAIIKRKAALESLSLPEEVAHLISEKISSNVRELEGALTRLFAVSSLKNSTINLELARAALKPLLQSRQVNISIDDIKKAVALHFGVKVSELVSKRRTKNLSYPRHIAMYLCRKHTSTSYPEIGGQFGGRDHSSVIHAANTISLKVASDSEIKSIVTDIEKRLLG